VSAGSQRRVPGVGCAVARFAYRVFTPLTQRAFARSMQRVFALGLTLALCGAAQAHQASDAYLRARSDADGRLLLQVDVALRDLDIVLALDADDDGRLRWGEVRPRQAEIAAHVAAHIRLDEGRCALRSHGFSLDRKADAVYAVLDLRSDCRADAIAGLGYRLLQDVDPTHRGLLLVFDAAGRAVGPLRSLVPGGPALPLAASAAFGGAAGSASGTVASAAGFFAEGLHHILIGADHVLFLVCLLLPVALGRGDARQRGGSRPAPLDERWSARLWPLLGLVTAFTVAHSITLGLAAWRVLSVPPSIIEPLIAATIALAALDNLWPRLGPRRVLAAFGFGLIHGFGFAGPLLELDLAPWTMAWALLQFNLGVEAGQLIVVLLALALLAPLRAGRGARPLLRGGSVAAGLLALLWMGERLFDFKLLPV
jgi:hypothetical protein